MQEKRVCTTTILFDCLIVYYFIFSSLEINPQISGTEKIYIDDMPHQGGLISSEPKFTTYGIDLKLDDINSLQEGKMMNDNIVTVLLRCLSYLF